jgi:hypothetical protein
MGSAGGGSDLCVGLYGGRMGLGLCAVTAGIGQVAVVGVGYGCEFAWYRSGGGCGGYGAYSCGCL